VAPATLAVSASFPAPTVSTSVNANATPLVLFLAASFPAPAVRRDQNVTPATLTVSTSFPSPGVTIVLAGYVTAAAAFPQCSVRAGQTVAFPALAVAFSFPAPTMGYTAEGSSVSSVSRIWSNIPSTGPQAPDQHTTTRVFDGSSSVVNPEAANGSSVGELASCSSSVS
jgi:hypothetical protein